MTVRFLKPGLDNTVSNETRMYDIYTVHIYVCMNTCLYTYASKMYLYDICTCMMMVYIVLFMCTGFKT